MTAKPPLTLDQHRELGKDLFALRNKLQRLYVDLAKHYPLKTSHLRKLDRAQRLIDEARSDFDNDLFYDHPGEGDVAIYYPGSSPYHYGKDDALTDDA